MNSKNSSDRRRGFSPISDLRAYRLRAGVKLMTAAVHAGMSLTKASHIEREPMNASAADVKALRDAVDEIVAGGAA